LQTTRLHMARLFKASLQIANQLRTDLQIAGLLGAGLQVASLVTIYPCLRGWLVGSWLTPDLY
jgi:hypothetical protein